MMKMLQAIDLILEAAPGLADPRRWRDDRASATQRAQRFLSSWVSTELPFI
jgi:hypothetical protein